MSVKTFRLKLPVLFVFTSWIISIPSLASPDEEDGVVYARFINDALISWDTASILRDDDIYAPDTVHSAGLDPWELEALEAFKNVELKSKTLDILAAKFAELREKSALLDGVWPIEKYLWDLINLPSVIKGVPNEGGCRDTNRLIKVASYSYRSVSPSSIKLYDCFVQLSAVDQAVVLFHVIVGNSTPKLKENNRASILSTFVGFSFSHQYFNQPTRQDILKKWSEFHWQLSLAPYLGSDGVGSRDGFFVEKVGSISPDSGVELGDNNWTTCFGSDRTADDGATSLYLWTVPKNGGVCREGFQSPSSTIRLVARAGNSLERYVNYFTFPQMVRFLGNWYFLGQNLEKFSYDTANVRNVGWYSEGESLVLASLCQDHSICIAGYERDVFGKGSSLRFKRMPEFNN